MSDFDKRLAAKQDMTPAPGQGYNLVGMDSFEEPGEELYLIGHFPTKREAERVKEERQRVGPPGEVLYIYGSER